MRCPFNTIAHELILLYCLCLEGASNSAIVGHALKELARVAPAKIQPFFPQIVPLCFLARFDPEEDLVKV